MSYFRPDLHRYFASQFVDGILHKKSTLYYFLGRTYPWETTSSQKVWNEDTSSYESVIVSEDYPEDLPDNSDASDTKIRDDITYVKKLESNNVTLSIRRINWTKGTVYYQWDSTKEMNNLNSDKSLKTPYYVMNSDYSVYKCLFNNHGSPSTVEPTEKSYGILQTGDGYIWKYMYSIPKIQLTRFLSGDYIPCQKAITESFYNLGAVESVVVRDGGMNYKTGSVVYAVVDSPKLVESYIDSTQEVFTVNWLKDSEGSTIVPSTSRIYIVKTNGEYKNKKYRWSSSLSLYEETLDSGLRAEISLNIDESTGSITTVDILKKGRGYDSSNPPSIVIVDEHHTGTGKYGTNPSAILEANIIGGQLDTVTIVDPGISYSSESLTKLVVIGDGKNCTVKPVIEGGKIVSVNVTNGGTGYTHARINVVTSKEQGVDYGNVDLVTVLGGNSISTDQGVVEQTTINGAIYAIEVTNGGNGYTSECSVVVEGDGEGCSCEPVIVDGAIQSVTVDEEQRGSGYTSSDTIIINDPLGSGEGCSLSPVVGTDGEVLSITVNNPGKNYSSNTTLTISSTTGEGCSLTPNIEDGVLRYINVTSYGKNYTRAEIKVSDNGSTRTSTEEKTYIDAEAYPIISPIGGHGSNAVSELNACTATVYLALRYADSFGTLNQEFRQFGVLSNLTSYKNLVSTVYGVPVLLNDTNWLFNSTDGLISQKLIEPVVTVYDPLDSTDEGYQYKIHKSTTSTSTIQNYVDSVNMTSAGANYLSYPQTTATVEETEVIGEENTGEGCELKPYIKGEINSVTIEDGGYGFDTTTVVVKKNGTVDNDTFIKLSITKDGQISGATVVKSSSGHTSSTTTLEINSSVGSEGQLTPVITSGKITGVVVTNHGKNYKFLDLIVTDKSNNGSGCVLSPTLINGVIASAKVDYFGTGYSSQTKLVVVDESGEGQGAQLTPNIVNGRIDSITVVNGGYNYPTNITINVVDPKGTGSGAAVTPTVHNGIINSISIIDAGENYIEKSTSVSANTNVHYFGDEYEDPEIKLTFKGSIDFISVESSGQNYSKNKSYVNIESETGSGAGAEVNISSNKISEICLEPLTDEASNFTINSGYQLQYINEDTVQTYKIIDVISDYIPIRNKSETNSIISEENLGSVITLKNYNYETGEYPGLRYLDPESGEYKINDIIFTITQNTENTVNYVQYRLINVSGREILIQPLTFIPRTLTAETSTVEGDTVSYSYTQSGLITDVKTVVNGVVSNCTIDKYSGNLLYVANMKPLEFFEGKVAAVRTNIYF